MKEKLTLYARHVILCCLFVLPIPFGLITLGTGPAMMTGVLIGVVLSLIVPLYMQYKKKKKGEMQQGESYIAVLYSWLLTALFVAGSSFSAESFFSSLSTIMNIVVTTLLLMAFVALQHLIYTGVAYWQVHKRRHWLSPFIDTVLYALPLPTFFLGTVFCLFLSAMSADDMTGGPGIFAGFMMLVGFGILLLAFFVIATLVFYFYPHKREYPTWWPQRALAFLRIVIMGIVWLIAHNLILGQVLSVILNALTVQRAVLSYILFFLIELIILSVSIAFGQLIPCKADSTDETKIEVK